MYTVVILSKGELFGNIIFCKQLAIWPWTFRMKIAPNLKLKMSCFTIEIEMINNESHFLTKGCQTILDSSLVLVTLTLNVVGNRNKMADP